MTVDRTSRLFELWDIYCVLDMGTNNLLLVTYIVQKGYSINFGSNTCEISKARSIIGRAKNRKRLWVLDGSPIMPDLQVAHIAKVLLSVWHKQLGHVMICSVKKPLESSMVIGMELTDDRQHRMQFLRNQMWKILGDYTRSILMSVDPLTLKAIPGVDTL